MRFDLIFLLECPNYDKSLYFYFFSSSESVNRASSSDIKYKTMGVGRRVGKEKFVPVRLSARRNLHSSYAGTVARFSR